MVREIASALLIALLCVGAFLNVRRIDSVTGELTAELQYSERAAAKGDTDEARRRVEVCLSRVQEFKEFTYATMRHEETDAVANALYQLMEALPESDADIIAGSYARVYYQIDAISQREHITLESVL